MKEDKQEFVTLNDFEEDFRALVDTEWMADPADPTNEQQGLIRKGETIWFQRNHFGSGPAWQQARFKNKTLGYVHLADFEKIDIETLLTP